MMTPFRCALARGKIFVGIWLSKATRSFEAVPDKVAPQIPQMLDESWLIEIQEEHFFKGAVVYHDVPAASY